MTKDKLTKEKYTKILFDINTFTCTGAIWKSSKKKNKKKPVKHRSFYTILTKGDKLVRSD